MSDMIASLLLPLLPLQQAGGFNFAGAADAGAQGGQPAGAFNFQSFASK
jgi:hypothetical protein